MQVRDIVGVPVTPSMLRLADLILNVPYFRQEQTNWCWAGCSEMIYHYYGITNIRQCDMASAEFGAACCSNPGSSVCNQPNWPENALSRVGIRSIRSNGAANVFTIRAEIGAQQPMMTYYAWTGGGAHVAVLRGVYANGDLDINDPWYGPGRRTYNAVLSGYGYGQWAMSYTGIRR